MIFWLAAGRSKASPD